MTIEEYFFKKLSAIYPSSLAEEWCAVQYSAAKYRAYGLCCMDCQTSSD